MDSIQDFPDLQFVNEDCFMWPTTDEESGISTTYSVLPTVV